MYSEETFKNYIFWLKVKRVFFILLFSVVGCLLGLLLSHVVIEILKFDANLKIVFVVACTLVFFALSLLLTAGTGKEVQDGYWKIAVLRKLTVISKKLDRITVIEPNQVVQGANVAHEVHKTVAQVLNEVDSLEDEVDLKEADKQDKQLVKEEDIKEDIKDIVHEEEPVEEKEVVKERKEDSKAGGKRAKDKKDSKKEVKEEVKEESKLPDFTVEEDEIEDVYPKIPTIRDEIE